jgi:hypothetical protein
VQRRVGQNQHRLAATRSARARRASCRAMASGEAALGAASCKKRVSSSPNSRRLWRNNDLAGFGRVGQSRRQRFLAVQIQAKLKMVGQQKVVNVLSEAVILRLRAALQVRQVGRDRLRLDAPDLLQPVRHDVIRPPVHVGRRRLAAERRAGKAERPVPRRATAGPKVPVRQFAGRARCAR